MTIVNQSRPTSAARADPEAEVECGIHTSPPSRLPVFIYLNLFVKPGPRPGSQQKWVLYACVVLILGAINARRSFNEEKLVKQQAILTTKKVRLHEEIRKALNEEYSRFSCKIWCWGKNLTRKRKNKTKKE